MLRGGHAITNVPDFLESRELPTATTTAKSSASEHTNKRHEVSKSTVSLATKAYPTEAEGKNILKPVGKVGFLEDYRTVMVQRAIFQGLASMGLPAFTIHSVYSLDAHKKLFDTYCIAGRPLFWARS